MDFSATPDLTSLLERAAEGDATAQQELWSSCYEQLRLIASAALQRWNGRVSLQSTDVLHEAFARLVDRSRVTERGHRYFLKSFATECRRLLVEHWRAKQALVRGGDRERVTMVSQALAGTTQGMDLLELSDVIETLAREDARAAQIVDLRLFGGLSVAECSEALGVAIRTVESDWTFAKAWLQRKLGR